MRKLHTSTYIISLVAFGLFFNSPLTAQIYLANWTNGTVGEYTLDGTVSNASLISGFTGIAGIAVSGSNLFISSSSGIGKYTTSGATVNATFISSGSIFAVTGSYVYVKGISGTIGEYDITTGKAVNASLIKSAGSFTSMTVSGSNLFLTNPGDGRKGDGTIEEFDAATGNLINASFISGLSGPMGIITEGSNLFVMDSFDGVIGKYNLDGTLVSATLISGLGQARGISASESDLFIINGTGTVEEFDFDGTLVNNSLISGLNNDFLGIAVEDVPEPSTPGAPPGWFGCASYCPYRRVANRLQGICCIQLSVKYP